MKSHVIEYFEYEPCKMGYIQRNSFSEDDLVNFYLAIEYGRASIQFNRLGKRYVVSKVNNDFTNSQNVQSLNTLFKVNTGIDLLQK